MNYYPIANFSSSRTDSSGGRFENAFFDSRLKYSFKNLNLIGDISKESILEALGKSMRLCDCAGKNSKNHFKQIYVFDDGDSSLHIDWMMSKTGFNILILQIPALNRKMAQWIWKLADPE
jgi:hypothetical protein